jgi:pre-mRNA-splicing factor SPF27
MGSAQPPLALPEAAFSEEKSWRRHQHLITAFPYVEGLDAAEREAVNTLIEEELQRADKQPDDYLQDLPPVPPSRLQDDQLMQTELARVARGERLAAMDLTRYDLNPPAPSDRTNPAAWQTSVDNARAQLEHQRNRLLNLELLLKFGPDALRAHNEALSADAARLQGKVGEVRAAVEALNRERKLQQTAAGREIRALQEEYLMLVSKNAALEAACRAMEAETTAGESHANNN